MPGRPHIFPLPRAQRRGGRRGQRRGQWRRRVSGQWRRRVSGQWCGRISRQWCGRIGGQWRGFRRWGGSGQRRWIAFRSVDAVGPKAAMTRRIAFPVARSVFEFFVDMLGRICVSAEAFGSPLNREKLVL